MTHHNNTREKHWKQYPEATHQMMPQCEWWCNQHEITDVSELQGQKDLYYFRTNSLQRAMVLWVLTALLPFSCSGRSKLARNRISNMKEHERDSSWTSTGRDRALDPTKNLLMHWLDRKQLWKYPFLKPSANYLLWVQKLCNTLSINFLNIDRVPPKYFAQGLTHSRERAVEPLPLSCLTFNFFKSPQFLLHLPNCQRVLFLKFKPNEVFPAYNPSCQLASPCLF